MKMLDEKEKEYYWIQSKVLREEVEELKEEHLEELSIKYDDVMEIISKKENTYIDKEDSDRTCPCFLLIKDIRKLINKD